MSHILEFNAASGTLVDGVSIAAAPASTSYSGTLITNAAGSVINAAFNVLPHTADNSQPFIYSGVFRKGATTVGFTLGSASYGTVFQMVPYSPALARVRLGALWRGDAVWGDLGLELSIADGDLVPFVVRGVWSSATTYAIDFFILGNKYSGVLNTDPAHTSDRISWTEGVSKVRVENITLDDAGCNALLNSQLVGNASASGGTGTGTGTGSGGAATGGATGTGSFTSDVMENNTGAGLLASASVSWTWYKGAIGSAPTSTTHGTGATSVGGVLSLSGLPAGAGFLLVRTADSSGVYYQPGTVA